MRYVVYGAGAIGGTIGARLHQHGRDVVLVARGPHHDALQNRGLRFLTPEGDERLVVPVARHPGELELRADDVVVLAMKTQDTAAALDDLAAAAPPGIAVVCAQNGVENERLALRRFRRVYGMAVVLPAEFLEPGVVVAYSAARTGLLDLGLAAGGVDATAEAVAADLEASTFRSRAVPDIMRWKYAKLLMNLGNALDAACGRDGWGSDLFERARQEGVAALDAAGIAVPSDDEDQARRGDYIAMRPAGEEGRRHQGSSSWQSLARRTGSIEADYLNGEIVLLGRLHGVPTPVNEALQRVAGEMARAGAEPGSLPMEELEALVAHLAG